MGIWLTNLKLQTEADARTFETEERMCFEERKLQIDAQKRRHLKLKKEWYNWGREKLHAELEEKGRQRQYDFKLTSLKAVK